MLVLVDTSVWVEHFKKKNSTLLDLLQMDCVLSHPMVIGELACGTPPKPRIQTLSNIGLLKSAKQATLHEVMDFIEHEKVFGVGCGLVDLLLLVSTLITPGATLWTLDKHLSDISDRFKVKFYNSN